MINAHYRDFREALDDEDELRLENIPLIQSKMQSSKGTRDWNESELFWN